MTLSSLSSPLPNTTQQQQRLQVLSSHLNPNLSTGSRRRDASHSGVFLNYTNAALKGGNNSIYNNNNKEEDDDDDGSATDIVSGDLSKRKAPVSDDDDDQDDMKYSAKDTLMHGTKSLVQEVRKELTGGVSKKGSEGAAADGNNSHHSRASHQHHHHHRGPHPHNTPQTALSTPNPHALLDSPKTFLTKILNPYEQKAELHKWVAENILEPMKGIPDMGYMESKHFVDSIMRKMLNSDVVPSFKDLQEDPNKVFGFMENIFAEGSLSVKLSVHYNLYGMMISLLGNDTHHKRFLSNFPRDDIGAFAMTELYTGTDVKSLGTTMSFNSSDSCFYVDSNSNCNQKFWIGNSLVSARYAIVFGQLITKGNNYGIHAIVVELRDENGNLKPGITIKDCGRKGGLNALDNGAIWFDRVKVPRENLLNRYADVSSDGTYQSDLKANKRFALHIGALLFARVGVGSGGLTYSKVALAIALRYSFQRKQFVNPKNGQRIRIIDYELQQHRLIPLLAETFAANFFQYYVKRVYCQYYRLPEGKKKDELLKQTHLMASISKAQISWLGLRALDESRACCGGQGYKFDNRLVFMRDDCDILRTLDGVNELLMEAVTQVLLGEYTKEMISRNFISRSMLLAWEKASDFLAQGLITSYYRTSSSHLTSEAFIMNALDYRKERMKHTLAARLYNRIVRNKKDPFLSFNECAVHAVDLGKAYSEFSVLKAFQKMLLKIEKNNRKDPEYKRVIRVLRDMFTLHGLVCISNDKFFLENGCISSSKSKAIRKEIAVLVGKITPHSLFLIEQFDMPEYIFDGSIGSKQETLDTLHPKPTDDVPPADSKWTVYGEENQ